MKFRNALRLVPLKRFRDPAPVVAVVRLAGILAPGGAGLRRGTINLERVGRSLERAFGLKKAKAVALIVNSPGGSPVQSSLIAKTIRDLATEKEKPVYAFAEDVAASGGYWLASAADEIYANESSIIGSIGVISSGFGFPELIRRHGIERRVYSAGDNKSQLDPFLAEDAQDIARLKAIQNEIHEAFKTQERTRRGDRLGPSDEPLFSGEFWGGKRALELGLIDAIGDLRSVTREKFGERVKLVQIGERRPWFERRFGFGGAHGRAYGGAVGGGGGGPGADGWLARVGDEIGGDLIAGAIAAVEERALWNRFGL